MLKSSYLLVWPKQIKGTFDSQVGNFFCDTLMGNNFTFSRINKQTNKQPNKQTCDFLLGALGAISYFEQSNTLSNTIQFVCEELGWRSGESTGLGPSSIPGLGVVSGLSLLLARVLASRGVSPDTLIFPSPQKPTFLNSNSMWKVLCVKYIKT